MAFFEYREDTQQDFQQGTLSGVVATPDGTLQLDHARFYDGFDVNSSASYTASYDTDGTWQWDTANSRVVVTGGAQALRLRSGFLAKDVRVETHVDQAGDGGLVLRYQDNNTYYLLAIRDDASGVDSGYRLRIYKRVAGTFTTLAGTTTVSIPRGVLSHIVFEAQGSTLRAYLNGVKVLEVTDTSITAAGLVGMRNYDAGGGITHYYDLAAEDIINFQGSGVRISPVLDISPVGLFGPSLVAWSQALPAGTALTVETNLSLDGGLSWQGWQVATNGQSVPGIPWGADLSNARLQIRETLSATDTTVTPALLDLLVRFGAVVDLPASGVVPHTGELVGSYTVIPVGFSDMPSGGTVHEHRNLPSQGGISATGELVGSYTVIERPKVTTALSPVKDAFVWDKEPALNYGDVQDIAVGRSRGYLARGLVQFDISTLRTDLIILSATLRLRCRFAGSGQIGVYPLLGTWDEYGVTWANQPAAVPAPVATTPAPTQVGASVDFEITNLFLGWYQGTRTNVGVGLRVTDETTMASTLFGAREAGVNWQAQLLVTYYEPDALAGQGDLGTTGGVRQLGAQPILSLGEVRSPIQVDDCGRETVVWRGWCFQTPPADLRWTRLERIRLLYRADDRWPPFSAPCCDAQFTYLDPYTGIRHYDVYCDYYIYYLRQPGPCEVPTSGRVSHPALLTTGTAFQVGNLPSTGFVRGPEFEDLPTHSWVSRPDTPSTGIPRLSVTNDFASRGFVPYASDLPTQGSPRVVGQNDLASAGYVAHAPNEISTTGAVRWTSDLPTSGSVGAAPNQLPTVGTPRVTGMSAMLTTGYPNTPYLGSLGVVHQYSDLFSLGSIRVHADLPTSGFMAYRDVSDLPNSGIPRIRAASDLPSTGFAKGGQSDLGSHGIVTAVILDLHVDLSAWPPQGGTTFPSG